MVEEKLPSGHGIELVTEDGSILKPTTNALVAEPVEDSDVEAEVESEEDETELGVEEDGDGQEAEAEEAA